MAQVYLDKFIAIIRVSSSDVFRGYTAGGSTIVEQTTAANMQNAVKTESADDNQKIYNELKIDNFISFDETGAAPTTGDLTYSSKFVGLIIKEGKTVAEMYTGSGSTIIESTDKTTFLTTLRTEFGDSKFRIFQETVQSHTHGFVLVV